MLRRRPSGRRSQGLNSGMITVEGLASDFGWFTTWVYQRLGLCLTFAGGLSREQLLAGFGLGPQTVSDGIAEETFDQADDDPNRPKVRVGELHEWAYAVEHFTSKGANPGTLRRLSARGGEALALVCTQTISMFTYAADGEYVCGFDLVVPNIRSGSDPHRFDTTMEHAGFLRSDARDRTPAMGARFVQLTFGITIDKHTLERALPSVELK